MRTYQELELVSILIQRNTWIPQTKTGSVQDKVLLDLMGKDLIEFVPDLMTSKPDCLNNICQ